MIADSTCIICLSKINRLELLKDVFNFISIPRAVKREVLVEGKDGILGIQNAFDAGWLKVVDAKKIVDFGLGAGENEAISLARERNDTLILDDAHALKVAEALHFNTIRTTSVIFIAVKKKIIDRKEAIILLNELIETGYYLSPGAYAVLLTKLKES